MVHAFGGQVFQIIDNHHIIDRNKIMALLGQLDRQIVKHHYTVIETGKPIVTAVEENPNSIHLWYDVFESNIFHPEVMKAFLSITRCSRRHVRAVSGRAAFRASSSTLLIAPIMRPSPTDVERLVFPSPSSERSSSTARNSLSPVPTRPTMSSPRSRERKSASDCFATNASLADRAPGMNSCAARAW